MTDYVAKIEGVEINLSPDGFRRWAEHYYKCRHDFEPPDDGWSPVPYFLLCLAIELQLKAWHLETRRQKYVKDEFGHDLVASYRALDPRYQTLTAVEYATLGTASTMYESRRFQYMQPIDAMTGFSRAPRLEDLDTVAAKLIAAGAEPAK